MHTMLVTKLRIVAATFQIRPRLEEMGGWRMRNFTNKKLEEKRSAASL
jgi:hypothetical protein